MKDSADQSLDRLLRAAGNYRPATANAEEAPFGFATRVAAEWLATGRREGWDAQVWFRRAFLCALAVMVATVGWSFKTDTTAPNEEIAIASYDSSVDLP